MSARSSTLAVAVLVVLGVAAWGLSSSDVAAPPPPGEAAPPRAAARSPRAARAPATQGPRTASAERLYRPPLRTDRVSVVGAEAQGRVQGITPEEAAKFEAIERPSSPVAIQSGEEEKEVRREEAQRRRELRKRGIDPGPRDRSDSGPGERVGELQEVLDEQAEQVGQAAPDEGER